MASDAQDVAGQSSKAQALGILTITNVVLVESLQWKICDEYIPPVLYSEAQLIAATQCATHFTIECSK